MKKILPVLGLLFFIGSVSAFSDVSDSHPNYKAIAELQNLDIIAGYADGTFKPSNNINRAELTKIVVGAVNSEPLGEEFKNCFPDVQEEWFAPYICYAKAQGWVAGYPDGTFKPANNVLKVESTKIIMGAFGAEADKTDTPLYDDVDNAQWFAPFIRVAKLNGILEEVGTEYEPAAKITRAQVSENIYRSKNVFSGDNSLATETLSAESDNPALIGKKTINGSTVQASSGSSSGSTTNSDGSLSGSTGGSSSGGTSSGGTSSGSSGSGDSGSGGSSGEGTGDGETTPPPEPTSVVWDGCSVDEEKTEEFLPEGSESQFYKCDFSVAFSQEEGESIDPTKVFARITLNGDENSSSVFPTGFGGETGTISEGGNGEVASFSVWYQLHPLSVMHTLNVPVFKGANLLNLIEIFTQ